MNYLSVAEMEKNWGMSEQASKTAGYIQEVSGLFQD
jgi:hypothetical protein